MKNKLEVSYEGKMVLKEIRELEGKWGLMLPEKFVYDALSGKMDKKKITNGINNLRMIGEIFKPRKDYIQRTDTCGEKINFKKYNLENLETISQLFFPRNKLKCDRYFAVCATCNRVFLKRKDGRSAEARMCIHCKKKLIKLFEKTSLKKLKQDVKREEKELKNIKIKRKGGKNGCENRGRKS
jgi:hypothetical protein